MPNQPLEISGLPGQDILVGTKKKVLTFQCSWFKRFPWLHISETNQVLCFYCSKASRLSLLSLTTQNEDTFTHKGFVNWKKAMERFDKHEKSACHNHAVYQVQQLNKPSVCAQLSEYKLSEQAINRSCLVQLFSSIRFLARQALPFRGHLEENGNYCQLLTLMAQTDAQLKQWLNRVTNFTSHDCQNEMLALLAHAVVRKIVSTVKAESCQFALVVDGTQDCAGLEQEAICIRFVDKTLKVSELFIGMYNPHDTTGQTLSLVVKDVLTRLTLSLDDLRAQTYDGAANMSGKYNGCQAFISKEQPLALFFHCSAHCANLVAQHTAATNQFVSDPLQLVQDLGTLYNRSGKFKRIFSDSGVSLKTDLIDNPLIKPGRIKPLCPTRWLTRVSAVSSVLDQYAVVLASLESYSKEVKDEPAAKARGLLNQLQQGTTVLGLKVSVMIFSRLEQLNKSLQSVSATVSGMIAAAESVVLELRRFRADEQFNSIFREVAEMVEAHDLEPIVVPRVRRPAQRYCGQGAVHVAKTPEEHYRAAYYAVIDDAIMQLTDRFNKESTGLQSYLQLETMLMSGTVSVEVCKRYHNELNAKSLASQLSMFSDQNKYVTLQQAQEIMQNMIPEVRCLFPQVERLIRLMLLCPATSCSAERSFSALRRLKTWLRSTMTQPRLNAVAVCQVHQDILDSIDITKLAEEFASRSDIRRGLFGNWV